MDHKKRLIIETAVKLFAQNGYHATSMQAIADQCGISKGALYLHFKSKEELLVSILEYFQSDTLEKMAIISKNDRLTPKEKLIHQLYVYFYNSLYHSDFIKTETREQLNPKSDAVKEYVRRTRKRMLNWKKEALLTTYGEVIQPYLWDLVFIFHAILNEYRQLLVFEKRTFDLKRTAAFIVECIDSLVHHFLSQQVQPIIIPEMVADLDLPSKSSTSQNETPNSSFNQLVEQIQRSQLSESELNSLKILLDLKSRK